MKYRPRTKPFPHQSRATVRALRHRNFALWMEPRTGKSKVALDYAGAMAMKRKGLRVAIVAPKQSLDVWDQQIEEHFTHAAYVEDYESQWRYIDHSKTREYYGTNFYLIAYERIRYRRRGRGNKYIYPYIEELEAWRPDVYVLDESHWLRRSGGVTAQALWRSVRRQRKRYLQHTPDGDKPMPWVLELTGTPNPKGWISVFPQFRVMDDSILGTSKASFEEKYVVYGQGYNKYRIVRYRNEKRLIRKLRQHSYTVTAEEAGLSNLMEWQAFRIDLPPRARRYYDELATEFITQTEAGTITASNQGVLRLRLLQITGGFTTDGRQIHDAKIKAIRTWADSLIEQEEYLVLYARFLPEVAAASATLQSAGYTSRAITGRTSGRDRSQWIAEFRARKGTTPRALVFQAQVGSLSLDLTAAAEVGFYSCPDAWDVYWQCLQRVRGPAQKKAVRYSHFPARGTVDIAQIHSLRHKEDWHQQLYRNPKRYLRGMIQ